MTHMIKTFLRDESGVTLVESGIAILLAIVVGGGLILALGPAINTQFGDATALM